VSFSPREPHEELPARRRAPAWILPLLFLMLSIFIFWGLPMLRSNDSVRVEFSQGDRN